MVILFTLFIGNFIVEILYKLITKYRNINSIRDIAELERDIDLKYSPAIVSLLYDNKIEPKKDIVATILNLYIKKQILFYKNTDGKYVIEPNKNVKKKEMLPEERYIFTWLIEGKNFNYKNWVNIIKTEYKELDFKKILPLETRNFILIETMLICLILEVIEMSIILIYFRDNFWIIAAGILGILFLIGIVLATNNMLKNRFFNSIGKKEIKKWTSFKRFMYKYTLIKDSDVESILIYEKYMPYSIALNVNKDYKKIWKDVIPKKDRIIIMLHYYLLENIILKPMLKIGNIDETNKLYFE